MSMKIPPYFSVFPVSGKRPLVQWADYSKRLPTPEEKAVWALKFGHNYSVGIATGEVSKVLVLDDDGGLDLSKYPVPRTLTQNTPRGGKHYFLRWTPELENKITTKVNIFDVDTSKVKGVDVRGAGGFAAFYGFAQPYWTVPLASPPKWLLDLLPEKGGQRASAGSVMAGPGVVQATPQGNLSKSYLQEMLDDIKPGNRNDSFTRIAGSLRNRGYSPSDIYGVLVSKAREVGFGEHELRTICESVGRYLPKQTVDEQASSIDEFLKDEQKVEWICDGIIAKSALHFVAGLNGTMKTWSLIDLAIECAKGGGMWLGKFPVKAAKVLFIDQERFKGETQRRFKAVLAGKGLNASSISSSLHVRSGTSTRLDLQQSFDAFRKELSEIRPDIVIVDSFATFHTKNENLRQEIQVVLERVKELRNEFGCSFIFIHHENGTAYAKDDSDPTTGQMAGSEAIPAAADVVMTVRKQNQESSMIYMTKNNLSPSIPPFLVKVVDVTEDKSVIKVEGY